jgi:hypothetical protein
MPRVLGVQEKDSRMTDPELLLLMDYTRYDESCQNPAVVSGELVECRLPKNGHPEKIHATRKGATVMEWTQDEKA